MDMEWRYNPFIENDFRKDPFQKAFCRWRFGGYGNRKHFESRDLPKKDMVPCLIIFDQLVLHSTSMPADMDKYQVGIGITQKKTFVIS